MATSNLEFPISELHGAIEKHGVVSRRKHYRAPNGKIIMKGKKEMYKIANPRDFDKTPQSASEQRNHAIFREASLYANAIANAAKTETNPSPELLTEVQTWQQRFEAQLPGIRGNKPDPEAPIDPTTGKRKRYVQFPAFIRAMKYVQLKAQP